MSQLSHIKNTEKGKLRFFSNVYTTFELQLEKVDLVITDTPAFQIFIQKP